MHLFVHHGVVGHPMLKILQFIAAGQVAIQQQIADLEEMRLFGQLFDGIAAVQQFTFITINVKPGS
jgi:hypothetical protein